MKVCYDIEYYIDLEILVFPSFSCLDSGSYEVPIDSFLLNSLGLSQVVKKGEPNMEPLKNRWQRSTFIFMTHFS